MKCLQLSHRLKQTFVLNYKLVACSPQFICEHLRGVIHLKFNFEHFHQIFTHILYSNWSI